jgi:hypothetical protein
MALTLSVKKDRHGWSNPLAGATEKNRQHFAAAVSSFFEP